MKWRQAVRLPCNYVSRMDGPQGRGYRSQRITNFEIVVSDGFGENLAGTKE
jgi:hypothetical protein